METQTHELKTWSEYFFAVATGMKTFEVRKADRDFRFGDTLILKEYNPDTGYTGDECTKTITYILSDPQFVKEGYVILGIQ